MTCSFEKIQSKENIKQLKNELIFYRTSANYWKSVFQKSVEIRKKTENKYKTLSNNINSNCLLLFMLHFYIGFHFS